MKKLLAIILSMGIAISFAACGKAETEENISNETNQVEAQKPENNEEAKAPEVGPLDLSGGTVAIGDVTLSAEFIKLDEPFTLANASKGSMTTDGNTVYLSDGASLIKKYTFDGNKLSFVKDITVKNADGIELGKDGQIYAGGGALPAKIYDSEGVEIGDFPENGKIEVAKNADFALTYFSGRDSVKKIVGSDSSDWVISGLKSADPAERKGPFKSVSAIEIAGDHVMVVGSIESGHSLVVFDMAGNELARGSEKLHGNGVHAMTETANGYMTASVSAIHLTKKDGTYIGYASNTKPLFGVDDNIWLNEFTPLSDGSVLAGGAVKRSDGVVEFVVFKIKGF